MTSSPGLFESPLGTRGWYPASPELLKSMLQEFEHPVKLPPSLPTTAPCAVILPHAGYQYCGSTAAYVLKLLRGKTYRRVIILGPSHHSALSGKAALHLVRGFKTPLGDCPVDYGCLSRLKSHPLFDAHFSLAAEEHSVQMMVPLLQFSLGIVPVVPIIVGQMNVHSSKLLADVIRSELDQDTLLVISSDFTHYGSRFGYVPFATNKKESLQQLDLGAFRHIELKNAAAFHQYCEQTRATICGMGPIEILLHLLPSSSEIRLLNYDTSVSTTGDEDNSVSYLSAAAFGIWSCKQALIDGKADLSDTDKHSLLLLARKSLEYAIFRNKIASIQEFQIDISPAMENVMGAFVTLKKEGRLRGCIGEIFPRRSLVSAVLEQAVNAGLYDPRFSPVTLDELADLTFEISALTQPVAVSSYRDICLGKHGIVLEKHGRSAVFLPQVASEQGWDLSTTLSHLSSKAGLPASAWQSDTHFLVFEAIVFHENEIESE